MTRIFTAAAISVGLLLAVLPSHASAASRQQYQEYRRLRGLIDRTQSDLQQASEMDPSGRQRDRYQDTQRSLSDFDRHLSQGRFKKSEIDHSIDHLRSILNHNTLQARSRDALLHDLEDLRMARDHYIR